MENQGAQNYLELMKNGVSPSCPACPHPSINLPENWNQHPMK